MMPHLHLQAFVYAAVLLSNASAQHVPGYNYDESKIPAYTLLDPLTLANGKPVTSKVVWWKQRRPEIFHLFEKNAYGVTPANAKLPLRAKLIETDSHALGGLAIRKQIDIYFTASGAGGMKMRMLLYLPVHAKGRSPVVLGLNFGGNQTVIDDPGIQPTKVWTKPKDSPLEQVTPDGKTRGSQTEEWQVEKVLRRGYGLATIYYGDIEPDFKDASQYSIRQLFAPSNAPDAWGAIGAWAFGLSRAIDYLESDQQVDVRKIAVTGHSRLGKVADWAAAQDPRIAIVLSTESGKGGQSIQRRGLGESVLHLEHSFPYWFCPSYAQWADHDQDIPVDGNLLLSLIAPRPVYVASANGDEWSDPRGEFLSAVSASRVYKLLGHQGLPTDAMPAVDQPIDIPNADVAYHVRSGKHDVTAFDWDQYLNFLDLHFGKQVHS